MHIRRRIWFHRSFYTIQARCEKEMTSTSYRPCHLTYKWTLFAVFDSSFSNDRKSGLIVVSTRNNHVSSNAMQSLLLQGPASF